ncbi:nuclear transport factor 2 family protein [Propionispira raffinosivorans]|uniref:nuclear transport factor 2 family protein n=1 Tax=Propionispira raffinosivorans TaxID=86959 RepID=UPI00037BB6EE|nr:nuclear transport factor 2 family protein [Propionispira raffinosivorans]
MTNQINQKIAEDFLCAYKVHDWDGIRSLLHTDIKWTLPGDGMISGTAVGADAVIERTKTIIAGGVQTKLHHILVGQNGLTLSLNNTATSVDGRILDEELATVLTVDNGLIIKIDTYLSDVSMMGKYFSK